MLDARGGGPSSPSILFWILLSRTHYRLSLHAAGLHRAGATVVLPSAAGGGKTTLTAKLLALGWHYMSDDCLLIDSDLRVKGVPTSLTIKESGRALAAIDFPKLRGQPISNRRDGRSVCYLSPATLTRQTHAITHLLFPAYADGAERANPQFLPLRGSEAVARLMPLATCPGELDRDWILQLISAIESWPAFRLQTGQLHRTATCIDRLTQARSGGG
jgi:hypothetical protein